MGDKRTVLFRVAYLVDLDEKEINDDNGSLAKLSRKFCNDRYIQIDDNRFKLNWASTSEAILDNHTLNCGQCTKCNAWVTDVEKDDSIEGLGYGASVEGKLYCDECLPKEHPVAF